MTSAGAFINKLRESHLRLRKGLFSRFIVDVNHICVAVIDRAGEVVAMSSDEQIANASAVGATIRKVFGDLSPGDTVITNDPYAGSAHVQDHWVFTPVQRGGEIDGAVLVLSHLADVGGERFGNYSPRASDIWHEGARTTPTRIRRSGALDRDVMETIKLNSRMPEVIEADVNLMIEVALDVATVAASHPAEHLQEFTPSSEEQVAAFALQIGDRSVLFSGVVHNCAGADGLVSLRLQASAGKVSVDFDETSAEADGFVNSTLATTTSAVARIVSRSVGCPPNAGVLRSLDIDAPEATLVNCSYPRAVGWSPYEPTATIDALIRRALSSWDLELGTLRDPAHGCILRPLVRVDGCHQAGCPHT